jgi:hypothetical protein
LPVFALDAIYHRGEIRIQKPGMPAAKAEAAVPVVVVTSPSPVAAASIETSQV